VQYLQPFLYFARKPKTGFSNVLLGCLAPLIPVVGEVVLLGYRAEVSDQLKRDPDLRDHPDVSLDKLGLYLQRGVWPFVARLLFAILFVPPALLLSAAAGFGVYQLVPEFWLGLGVYASLYFFLAMLGFTLLWPMEYHAQVMRKFAPLEDLKFAIRFARVCWLSTLISVLMYTMFSFLLTTIGLCLFCVGWYPALVIQQMAEQHLMTQLYRLYLEEGGEPLVRPALPDDRRRYEDDDDEPVDNLKRARRVETEE